MAIEDALVLATLLGEYWEHPDGHIEAFYLYEVRTFTISCLSSRDYRENVFFFEVVDFIFGRLRAGGWGERDRRSGQWVADCG